MCTDLTAQPTRAGLTTVLLLITGFLILTPIGAKAEEARTTALSPHDVASRAYRAGLRLQDGKLDLALAAYDSLVVLAPDDPAGYFGLAMVSLGGLQPELLRSRLENAITILQAAVPKNPENLDHRRKLGSALILLGRHAEALAHLEHVTGIDQTRAEDWYQLGVCQMETGALAAADSSLAHAGRLARTDIRILKSRAYVSLLSGNYDKARAMYSICVDASDSPEVRVGRAHALIRLGRIDEAKLDLQTALEMDPQYRAARDLLKSLSEGR